MQETKIAFDGYAERYDEEFTYSAVGKLQRNRVWKYLSKNISVVDYPEILELNCGTGEDAAWLLKNGFKVTATDISQEMVNVANRKLNKGKAIVFQSDIKEVAFKLGTKKFDLIFSDFGGLNCLDSTTLSELSLVFSQLLNPGGRMIFVVMSRNCRWEQWYFKRKKDLKSAYRRQSKEGIEVILFDEKFSTWYYSPEEIKSLFNSHFTLKTAKPIGIALPPSYLDNYFRKHKLLLNILNLAEKIIGGISSFSDKADHYLIDFVKK